MFQKSSVSPFSLFFPPSPTSEALEACFRSRRWRGSISLPCILWPESRPKATVGKAACPHRRLRRKEGRISGERRTLSAACKREAAAQREVAGTTGLKEPSHTDAVSCSGEPTPTHRDPRLVSAGKPNRKGDGYIPNNAPWRSRFEFVCLLLCLGSLVLCKKIQT